MKRLLMLLIISSLCLMCQRVVPTNTKNLKGSLCGVNLGNDYETYLNTIIQLQEKQPLKSKKRIVFQVKVHFISPNEEASLTKNEVKTAFATMNQTFLAANIQFRWDESIDIIKQNILVDNIYQDGDLEDKICIDTFEKSQINLYILANYKDIVGYTHYPILNINRIFMSRSKLQDASLIHEFGHFFGLLHTFENALSAAENVNDRNCSTNGDKICDTPADPFGASFLEDECKLFGEYHDAFDKTFQPDLANFMSYYGRCRSRFSQIQLDRMYFIAAKIKYPQMRMGV
jgi:Pregnancy-associated plasma protein-A